MQKKILVVEDENFQLAMYSKILRAEGYLVFGAEDLTRAREIYKNNAPDVCIVDVRLPDGNGIQLCRKLKQSIDTRHIPVIIMSAHAHAEESSQEAFADDFIAKPFDLNVLLKLIEKHLA